MTKNCLILGAPRSGTSMTAGCVATGEFFMGNDPLDIQDANPQGFFEDQKINWINDRIILLSRAGILSSSRYAIPLMGRLGGLYNQWSHRLSPECTIRTNDQLLKEIFQSTGQKPFCFKDPRFCYTLPIWKPYLKETVLVCVFRHPAENAESIVQFCTKYKNYKISTTTLAKAYLLIEALYNHVLLNQQEGGEWLFLHYQQVLNKSGIELLEEKLQTRLDTTFPDESLYRNRGGGVIPQRNLELYQRLCNLAGYKDDDL